MADDGDRQSEDSRRAAAPPPAAAAHPSTLAARLRFYAISPVYVLALKAVRAAIPSLVPVMAADLGFSMQQQGLLLASFFQGYFITVRARPRRLSALVKRPSRFP
jgi:hypothetical protein